MTGTSKAAEMNTGNIPDLIKMTGSSFGCAEEAGKIRRQLRRVLCVPERGGKSQHKIEGLVQQSAEFDAPFSRTFT